MWGRPPSAVPPSAARRPTYNRKSRPESLTAPMQLQSCSDPSSNPISFSPTSPRKLSMAQKWLPARLFSLPMTIYGNNIFLPRQLKSVVKFSPILRGVSCVSIPVRMFPDLQPDDFNFTASLQAFCSCSFLLWPLLQLHPTTPLPPQP